MEIFHHYFRYYFMVYFRVSADIPIEVSSKISPQNVQCITLEIPPRIHSKKLLGTIKSSRGSFRNFLIFLRFSQEFCGVLLYSLHKKFFLILQKVTLVFSSELLLGLLQKFLSGFSFRYVWIHRGRSSGWDFSRSSIKNTLVVPPRILLRFTLEIH